MAEEELNIILRAIDLASTIIKGVGSSAEELTDELEEVDNVDPTIEVDATEVEEATTDLDELEDTEITGKTLEVDDSSVEEATGSVDDLAGSLDGADSSVQSLNADLDLINAGMLLQVGEQISNIATNAEGMSQEMNNAAITVGQLATQTGIAEPQMVALVNSISNVTFPNDEAMLYIKSLDQMGVSSENLGASATNIDRINDAFGLGAQTTNSLAQELGVLGVDMNNVSSAFNALAYANSNTVGGMQNYFNFLRRYDSQFKDLGYDVDQASVIIAAATQKFGGGRAALTGLSKALDEAGTDASALEQALDMEAGSISNATNMTSQYEGQLQSLADEEMAHKTIVERLGAAWEDVSLSLSGVLSPLGSAIGLIGEVGSFGMQVNGLAMLSSNLRGVVSAIKEFNIVKAFQNALEGEGAIAGFAAALGITTEAAAAEGATTIFGGLAIAEGAALWPILAIIAALALLGAAVYEVGKYFGWWTDVGSMIDAVKAGIDRLWQAFINHPDVQSFLQFLTQAWNVLSAAVGNAISWVMSFFTNNDGGKFDIVAMWINNVSIAWEAMKAPIVLVINAIKLVINWFKTTYAQGKANIKKVQALFRALPGQIRSAVSTLVSIISKPFKDAYGKIKSTVESIETKVKSITGISISSITDKITKPFKDAYDGVVKWVDKIKSKAKEATKNIPIVGGMFGGADLAYGGEDLLPSAGYTREEMKIGLTQDINLSLDLSNVPNGIDENRLYGIVGEAMTSKEFLQAVASSNDFQVMDRKVKARINGKSLRARGGSV